MSYADLAHIAKPGQLLAQRPSLEGLEGRSEPRKTICGEADPATTFLGRCIKGATRSNKWRAVEAIYLTFHMKEIYKKSGY